MDTESPAKAAEGNTFSNHPIKIDELPCWEDVDYEPMAKAAPWESFWQFVITLLLAIGIVSAGMLPSPTPVSVYLVVVFLLLLLFGLVQWHNFAEHKRRGVAAREKDILFRKGLIWRQSSVLPFNRVQHIEIHRNPIERKLGLSSLRIFTAGGSGVDLQISGLEQERAEKLKLYILERAKQVDTPK